MLRIISGKYRGRRLEHARTNELRPTRDIVKEALFSMLKDYLPGANFLDLYCGTGSIGIEALSREVARVTFCDQDMRAIDILKRNLISLEICDNISIQKNDAARALAELGRIDQKFDIIYLDPPYREGLTKKTLNAIGDYDIISPSGIVVCEHFYEDLMPEKIANLSLTVSRRYGNSRLSFYVINKQGVLDET